MIGGTDPARPRRAAIGSSPAFPWACIAAAVVVANLPGLLHLVTTNPLVIDGYLVPSPTGWLPGLPFIDPNAGYTTQALGHLAALDWLHGHVPWWNPFEGVGGPLAGEMQSGAFFPPNILLALHQGMLIVQVLLEMVAGWSTYRVAHRLGIGRPFSTTAGVAFALCGTFAWFTHAPTRPVALLPLGILGVEQALSAAVGKRSGGWQLLGLALALSVLAGFPETAFLDALFTTWWAIVRIGAQAKTCWRPMLTKLVAGLLTGLALSAPLLVAFVGYLPSADVGSAGGALASTSLPAQGLAQLVLPYALGPIFGFHSLHGSVDIISTVWGGVGGYLSATLVAAALVGLVGRRDRMLRIGLGLWIALCLLRTFGYPPVVHVMAGLPGIRLAAFYRYADPSWELAAVLLAAYGLDDIARHLTRRRTLALGATLAAALCAWSAFTAWPLLADVSGPSGARNDHPHAYVVGSFVLAGTALSLLILGGAWAGLAPGRPRRQRLRHRGRVVMASAVCVEAIVLFGFPYLSAPTPVALDVGPVHWLQAHLGTDRFATLGPIQPGYGSYFGIAEVNVDDLPLPSTWTGYIAHSLDTNVPVHAFTGGAVANPHGPTPAEELNAHLANYEAVGVRYVVEDGAGTDPQGNPFPARGSPAWPAGPRLVYRDPITEIWELPTAVPAFTMRPESIIPVPCSVVDHGWNEATVSCPRNSVLVRQVQYLPGWSATVNGTAVPVVKNTSGPPGLFQQVSVPAGTSTVRFTYLPPYELPALVAAGIALVVILAAGRFRRLPVALDGRRVGPAHRPSRATGRPHPGAAADTTDRSG